MYLRCAVVLTFSALSGACTVIPGLNVSENSRPSGNEYKIVKSPDTGHYQVVHAGSGVEMYDIVPITPALLVQEAQSQDSAGQPAAALPMINPKTVPPEYVVGAGDVLLVTVWDHPELSNPIGNLQSTTGAGLGGIQTLPQVINPAPSFSDTYTLGRLVAADGTLFFPYVGTLQAGGKTVEQIRRAISDKLKSIINSPQVDVRVVNFRSQRVQVNGEVKVPGVITLDDTPRGILDAINQCGGLTPLASRRQAILVRQDKAYRIDLAALLSGKVVDGNPEVKSGDAIFVPDQTSDQVFVLGEIAHPAPVSMSQTPLTLTAALTVAGGMNPLTAADSGVLVFRRASTDGTTAKIFKLDMGNPVGMLLAGEFRLQPQDVVYVKATDFAKYNAVVTQLLPTITSLYELYDIGYLARHQ